MSSERAPQRTCLGCRQKKGKIELVRIVRTPGGRVEVDVQAKKLGRGAYLCPLAECWEQGLKVKRLSCVLRGPIDQEAMADLREFGRDLSGGANGKGD